MAYIELPKLYHPDFATPGRKPVGSVELEKNRIAASLCHLYMHALGGHDLCGRGGPLLPQSGALASKNDFKTQYNTDGYWLAENLNAPANEVTIVCRHNIINQNNSDNCWVFTNASDSTAIWEYLYNNDLRHRANGSADDLYVGAGDWISGKIVTHVYTFSATTAKCQIWENGRKLPLSIQENANNTNLIQKLRIGSDTSSYNPEHEVELIAILDRVLSDAECRLLSADVYSALIRPSIPMMYFTNSEISVSVSFQSLVLSAYNPSVQGDIDVALTGLLETLNLTQFNPTISLEIAPTFQTLELTSYSPTLSTITNTELESLSLSSYAATITLGSDTQVDPNVETLLLSSYAPTIQADVDVTTSPGAEALTITSYSPDILLSVLPGYESITLSSFAPTISTTLNVGLESLTLSSFAATITTGLNVVATLESLTLTSYPAATSADTSFEIVNEVLTLSSYVPTLTLGVTSLPGVQNLTLAKYDATITLDVDYDLDLESLVLSAFAPTTSLDIEESVTLVSLTLTPYNATITLSNNFTVTLESLTLNSFNVTLTTPTEELTHGTLDYSFSNNVTGYTIPLNVLHFTFTEE